MMYLDGFGNQCRRLMVPPGDITLRLDGTILDSGKPDEVAPNAREVPVEMLPHYLLGFLLGSRYCETDRLGQVAWDLFGGVKPGWTRVQAVCDFVHNHLTFGYPHAATDADGAGSLPGEERRVPRLRASDDRAVPLPQHPGALRQRISRRHRRAEGSRAHGLQRLGRGVSR